MKRHKYERILDIYIILESGKGISKAALANEYEVDEKTIQRDLDDIRAYYADSDIINGRKELVYDRINKRYNIEEV